MWFWGRKGPSGQLACHDQTRLQEQGKTMSQEITVVAVVKAKKGQEKIVADAMAACVPASRAEATNIQYVPNRDLDDPQTFVFIERWASRQALQDHMETPHFKTLAESIKDSVAEPISLRILQPLVAE